MVDFITAEEARRNAETCRNVIADESTFRRIIMRGELLK